MPPLTRPAGLLSSAFLALGLGIVGCGDESSPSNVAPTVTFTVQCTALGCRFVNGSTDTDGTLESYTWDFGDESAAATTRDANHTYAAEGTFTVTLTVTDDDGEAASGAAKVTVHAPADPGTGLTVGFSAECVGLTCQFTDRSTGTSAARYTWVFGDLSETVSARDAQHTYDAEGDYLVSLTVTDGARLETASQTLHVELVNLPPIAHFTYACTDLTCDFTDQSTDEVGGLQSFHWTFGDGQSSADRHPSHTYASAGSFRVELTVTDTRGATSTASRQLSLPAIGWPTADLKANCYGYYCSFWTESTGGIITEWRWSFGDGEITTTESPTHFYAREGTYGVEVTITDDRGVSNSVSGEVTVPVPLQAAFTTSCQGTTCTFTNQSTGFIGSAYWEFGDGTTSYDWNPFHVYQVTEPTTFSVRLTVYDWDYFASVTSAQVTVTP